MQIKFDVFWTKNLGTLYKDNSITTLGKEAKVDLDLKEVYNIHINFKVNNNTFTDIAHVIDIEAGLIRIPFKTDVIKLGTHELELVATMKNGDVLPSQTYTYTVDKSLENPNSVEAETNYPVLIELLNLAGNKLTDMDKSIQKVNTSIENMTNEISSYKEATTNALNSDISSYKEATTKELENNFNNYSNNTTSNIARVLDNKIIEVDNVVSVKSNELDVKFTTKSNEITKTLNDEITKVDKTLNSEINKVNTTLTNKVNEVDRVLENKVNEVDRVLDTTVTTIDTELDKKSKEVDNKVNAKIVEIDNRVNAKITNINTSLNNKINEVNTSLNNKINEVNEVIEEVKTSEQARKEEHTELVNELSSYSSDMNNIKDRVDTLETKVTDNEAIVDLKNKVNNHEERITTSEKTIRHQGILLNALNDLDDTISIEEEGTIISLPQSDDGKIIIDELQGNTLVNYCVDGAKELTLNNEINVQGTNVTLTDTVNNGKVDVVCEGNTLVNLMYEGTNVGGNSGTHYINASEEVRNDFASKIKTSTKYTIIMYNAPEEVFSVYFGGISTSLEVKPNVFILNTPENKVSNSHFHFYTSNGEIPSDVLSGIKVVILEGDYTNKPIPSYFEGMKSAFELEDNKVEIVGQSKNLFNTNNLYKDNAYIDYGVEHSATHMMTYEFDILPNTNYYYSNNENKSAYINLYNDDEFVIGLAGKSFNSNNCNKVRLSVFKDSTYHQLEEGLQATSYVPYATNTHSIQLSEPLRGLPNGVCDKFVKQGGKWYVERNCGEIDISNLSITRTGEGSYDNETTCMFTINTQNINWLNHAGKINSLACNSLPVFDYYTIVPVSSTTEGISTERSFTVMYLRINKSKLSTENTNGLKQWLSENPTTVVYQLATPTYEEITDPQLITYLDTTHISTNSTIPCNMQIKNSGYNTIIKPSTQYTVAFDTDKSGEVNIDLGGAKTSATNNVATITTPSTLTDDTLRLYGKGIKASKVRLLEGDKTSYIPSYFEGMKSCFEDKEQEDGSYEVEIVSNNKNLFDGKTELGIYSFTDGVTIQNNDSYSRTVNYIDVKGIDKIIISNNQTAYECRVYLYDIDKKHIRNIVISPNAPLDVSEASYIRIIYNNIVDKSTIQIEIGTKVTSYTPHKSNSIQLQLSEPLRAVGNVKDRFVLKDSKLMIERRFSQIKIKDSMVSNIYRYSETESTIAFRFGNMLYRDWQSVSNTSRSNLLYRIDSVIYDLEGYGAGDNSSDFYIRINKFKLDELTVEGMKKWLRNNEVILSYQLIEPSYEEVPYETQKLILECFENGTLFIDTLIPPTVSVTYSANKPVVAKLNQVDNATNVNTEDIAITQMAVDFLLMSSLGEEMINFKIKGGTNMSAYFASRIIKGALKYEDVISKYPNYKEDIDLILIAEGYSDLIVEL